MRDCQAYLALGANVIAKRNVVSCVACLDSRDAQRLGGKFPLKGRDFFLNMNGLKAILNIVSSHGIDIEKPRPARRGFVLSGHRSRSLIGEPIQSLLPARGCRPP